MCLANGHPDALEYPIGFLHDEANLIVERENARIATEAFLIQMAVAGILSQEAREAFTKRLEDLNVVTKPSGDLFTR
jgi:hypothetical protein